jgi:hypothetical protein
MTKIDEQSGAINALGQILSRCIQRSVPVTEGIVLSTLETLSTLLTITSPTESHIQLAAVQSIGLIARFNPLPLDEEFALFRLII